MKPRPQKWGQFLPEIGEPLLAQMRRVQELEQEAREARRDIMATIKAKWTREEILSAKYAANARLLTEAF